jgi:CDP-diacylglycerol--serine O-phosphatidyltransferase
VVAAVVYASDSVPLTYWPVTIAWLVLLSLLSFLMVSTWRYYSFKDLNLMRPWPPLTAILLGSLIYLIWNYSQPVLLACVSLYVSSGIFIRLGGIIRRHFRPTHREQPEHQIG